MQHLLLCKAADYLAGDLQGEEPPSWTHLSEKAFLGLHWNWTLDVRATTETERKVLSRSQEKIL